MRLRAMANSLDLLTLQQITMAPERLMMVRKQEKQSVR